MKLKVISFILLLLFNNNSFAQQQWEQTSGPEGARISSIVASPDGSIYASSTRGIYRSTNNGESWVELPNSPISDPPNLTSRLAVNMDGDVFALFHNALYRSLNSGNTWELIFEPASGTLQNIRINSQGDIFISGSAFYLSTDNGENWTMQNEINIYAFVIDSDDNLIGGTSDSIVSSTDNGATWNLVSRVPDDGGVYTMDINSQDHIFISAGNWRVYRSTDDGASWQFLIDTYYSGIVAVSPSDDVFVAYFENGIRVSRDNGETWEVINEGLTDPNVRVIAFDSINNIYAGTQEGVFRSTDDGENWQTSFSGLNSNNVSSLHTNPDEDIFAVTNTKVFRSSDNGDNWTLIYEVFHDSTIQRIHVLDNGDIYLIQNDSECQDCGAWDAHVFRSRDNGDTWEDIFFRLETQIECISINEQGEIFIKTFGDLFMSSDDGETFTPQPNPDSFYCNTVSTSNNTIYKVGSTVIGNYTRSTIDKSTDDGNSWMQTLLLDFPWQTYILRANSQDHLFAIVRNDYDIGSDTTFILRSIDEGATWDTVFFDRLDINDIEFGVQEQLYLATSEGIFFSEDNGDNWVEFNEGLEVLQVNDILVDSSGNLFAAPMYAGVWRNMLMVSTNNPEIDDVFYVYPNPSNSYITVNLPSKFLPNNTRLNIFNIQGRLVRSIPLMNSKLTMDISDLLPGLYLINVSGFKKGQVVIVN